MSVVGPGTSSASFAVAPVNISGRHICPVVVECKYNYNNNKEQLIQINDSYFVFLVPHMIQYTHPDLV